MSDTPLQIVQKCKSIIRKQLSRRHRPQIPGMELEKDVLSRNVRSVVNGLGNAMVLLLGPPGSGKSQNTTQTVKEVIDHIVTEGCRRVYISGAFHRTDNDALSSLCKQLRVDSISETLLLNGNFADSDVDTNLGPQPIIVIIDQLEVYCSRRTQKFLYVLLELIASSKVNIVVLACSCVSDIHKFMERRVRSRLGSNILRFSVFGGVTGYDNGQTSPQCSSLPLSMPSVDGLVAYLKSALTLPRDFPHPSFGTLWNENLAVVFGENSVIDILRGYLAVDRTLNFWISYVVVLLSRIDETHPLLDPLDFMLALQVFSNDPYSVLLKGLSLPELMIVVSMNNLHSYGEHCEVTDFLSTWTALTRFTSSQSSLPKYSRAIYQKAFCALLRKGLIMNCCTMSRTKSIPLEMQTVRLTLGPSQVKSLVSQHPGCPTVLEKWATAWVE